MGSYNAQTGADLWVMQMCESNWKQEMIQKQKRSQNRWIIRNKKNGIEEEVSQKRNSPDEKQTVSVQDHRSSQNRLLNITGLNTLSVMLLQCKENCAISWSLWIESKSHCLWLFWISHCSLNRMSNNWTAYCRLNVCYLRDAYYCNDSLHSFLKNEVEYRDTAS